MLNLYRLRKSWLILYIWNVFDFQVNSLLLLGSIIYLWPITSSIFSILTSHHHVQWWSLWHKSKLWKCLICFLMGINCEVFLIRSVCVLLTVSWNFIAIRMYKSVHVESGVMPYRGLWLLVYYLFNEARILFMNAFSRTNGTLWFLKSSHQPRTWLLVVGNQRYLA